MLELHESCLEVAQALVTASDDVDLGRRSVVLPLILLYYTSLIRLTTKAFLPPPKD